jgi:hypothetical protein
MDKAHDVISQRAWTDDELRASGFAYYERKKQVVMARPVTAEESPLTLDLGSEIVVVDTDYMLCYAPGDEVKSSPEEYGPWGVRKDIFNETYRQWDEPDWQPTPAEQDLLHHGCQPYYKAAGAWAKQLDTETYVLSIESSQPNVVAPGYWLAIGAQGDPWPIDDEGFRFRYIIPTEDD